ncbi:hypothetical protein SEA_HARAMBE_38 [Gordonia phage Harambe]|uniref:Uncharacterized protein n=7 Tax=Woesvirus woes TaxID=1982751 RepID=A0A2H4PFY4_9CAUD|nr:hypothetical protein SEA_ANAMIKA_38 [Gordonia phage Anamika]QAX94322.1 hypothetical protein SEA_GUILLAUME_38 [Gordonia phage Guillaume]QAX94644.1 hypothetical protein SEA_HARAMBE_38 [Gordonia phage Harambe]QAX95307.1 hypothetical protein SEA_HELLO_38 [Gordonia phage Hello]QAX95399.1 hypothetical protein SEA_NEOEVIE_38 [Gordonia phage Neoevie]QBP30316.1 hypothetical protein SEA_JORMUNGANDR_38 [Gordonia phage Jormungandr]QBP30611.1 hypothetical protein SEA_LAHIRIUM_38 [Gordonia phage Lahiriu
MASLRRATLHGTAAIRTTLRAVLGHTRVVASGSYPLYRLVCLFGIISALLAFAYRQWPPSFAESTDGNLFAGIVFSGMQLVGCTSIIVGMYLHGEVNPKPTRVQTSLAVERFGTVLLIPVIATYTYGVILNNQGPPTTWATSALFAFGLYLVIRFFEIGRALKEVQRPLEECRRDPQGDECE